MRKALGLLLVLPFLTQAQGVKFEDGLSWAQVQAKAKAEHKYIFADCFTTWCGPCKMMEKNIYPNDTVGNAMNSKFICVKVQLDTSKQDNDQVKNWYADAHTIMQQYKINAFPTFLFFSPEGKLVHRDLGYKKKDEFITLASNAVDPKKQYYTLKENYEHGKKDYAGMPYLVETAKGFKDKEFAATVAKDYIDNYLMKQKEEEIYTKKNIEFIAYNIKSSKGKAFDIFYRHGDKANKVAEQTDLSQRVVDYIISVEEINPYMDAAKKSDSKDLDWDKITKNIEKKYGAASAEKNVLGAKVRWYGSTKQWNTYGKFAVQQLQKFPPPPGFMSDAFGINQPCWNIFLYCTDRQLLLDAAAQEKVVIDRNPKDGNFLDTYANLLYKAGNKDEAIALEKKATELSPKADDIKQAYEKMLKGEPTWPKE